MGPNVTTAQKKLRSMVQKSSEPPMCQGLGIFM